MTNDENDTIHNLAEGERAICTNNDAMMEIIARTLGEVAGVKDGDYPVHTALIALKVCLAVAYESAVQHDMPIADAIKEAGDMIDTAVGWVYETAERLVAESPLPDDAAPSSAETREEVETGIPQAFLDAWATDTHKPQSQSESES